MGVSPPTLSKCLVEVEKVKYVLQGEITVKRYCQSEDTTRYNDKRYPINGPITVPIWHEFHIGLPTDDVGGRRLIKDKWTAFVDGVELTADDYDKLIEKVKIELDEVIANQHMGG